MSDDSNVSEEEKRNLEQAIEESKRTAQDPDLKRATEASLETLIKSNCNKSEFYLQNRGQGDCLFESVAQIFFPIDIRDDPDNYSDVDKASVKLRNMVYRFYQGIDFFEGFPGDPEKSEKERHSLDIKNKLVWATNEDLQILSYLLEFNYKIVNVSEQNLQRNNSYGTKYEYTFCNTILGDATKGNHWVLKRFDNPNDTDHGEKYGSKDFDTMLANGNQKIEALKKISDIPEFYMNAIILQGAEPDDKLERSNSFESDFPSDSEEEVQNLGQGQGLKTPGQEPVVELAQGTGEEQKEQKEGMKKVIIYIFFGDFLLVLPNKTVPVGEFNMNYDEENAFAETFKQIGHPAPPLSVFTNNNNRIVNNDNPNEIIYYVFLNNCKWATAGGGTLIEFSQICNNPEYNSNENIQRICNPDQRALIENAIGNLKNKQQQNPQAFYNQLCENMNKDTINSEIQPPPPPAVIPPPPPPPPPKEPIPPPPPPVIPPPPPPVIPPPPPPVIPPPPKEPIPPPAAPPKEPIPPPAEQGTQKPTQQKKKEIIIYIFIGESLLTLRDEAGNLTVPAGIISTNNVDAFNSTFQQIGVKTPSLQSFPTERINVYINPNETICYVYYKEGELLGRDKRWGLTKLSDICTIYKDTTPNLQRLCKTDTLYGSSYEEILAKIANLKKHDQLRKALGQPSKEPPIQPSKEPSKEQPSKEQPSKEQATQKVIIYIFVGTALLTLPKDGELTIPVGEYDTTVTPEDAFARTFEQTGFTTPSNFENKMTKKTNTNETTYYIFFKKGYNPQSDNFRLIEILDICHNYQKNDYFKRICVIKGDFEIIYKKMLQLEIDSFSYFNGNQPTTTEPTTTTKGKIAIIMYIFVGSSLVTQLDTNKELSVLVGELEESETLGDSFTKPFRQIGIEAPVNISNDNLSIEINPHEIIYYVYFNEGEFSLKTGGWELKDISDICANNKNNTANIRRICEDEKLKIILDKLLKIRVKPNPNPNPNPSSEPSLGKGPMPSWSTSSPSSIPSSIPSSTIPLSQVKKMPTIIASDELVSPVIEQENNPIEGIAGPITAFATAIPLTPNQTDALDKRDTVNLLKITQNLKREEIVLLIQDLESLRLDETTTISQIKSLTKILKDKNPQSPESDEAGQELRSFIDKQKETRERQEKKSKEEEDNERNQFKETTSLAKFLRFVIGNNKKKPSKETSDAVELLSVSLAEKTQRDEIKAKIDRVQDEAIKERNKIENPQPQLPKQPIPYESVVEDDGNGGTEMQDLTQARKQKELNARIKRAFDEADERQKEYQKEQDAKGKQQKDEDLRQQKREKRDERKRINGDEEMQVLRSRLANIQKNIRETNHKILTLLGEIDEFTNLIKDSELLAKRAEKIAEIDYRRQRQRQGPGPGQGQGQVNQPNTPALFFATLNALSLETKQYVAGIIGLIIVITILSLFLHYKLIEYTPYLILMCFLLGAPIIFYLLRRLTDPSTTTTDPKTFKLMQDRNKIYILFTIFMLFMTICTLMLIFNNGSFPTTQMPGELSTKENQTNSKIVFSIIAFLIVIGCITSFVISIKDFEESFEGLYQISNVLYVVLYIIFLIIFFYVTPKNTQNTYAYILVPMLILLGLTSFMYSFKQAKLFYDSKIINNYEKLKYFILLLCLITVIIIFYTINPGGYMTQYFGQTFSLAIAMMVFGFLFLIFSLQVSDNGTPFPNRSVFKRDKFVLYNMAVFIIFIIVVIAGIVYFPGGFSNSPMYVLIIILLLMILVGWGLFFGMKLFMNDQNELVSSLTDVSNIKSDGMKRVLVMIFGIIFAVLTIVWLFATFQDFASRSTIASGILNILMIIFALSLVYKILTIGNKVVNRPSKFQQGIDLILSIVFYIPCLITSPFDFFSSSASASSSKKIVYEYTPTIKNAFILFVMLIILWIFSLILPFIEKRVNLQGGKQIISSPISTNTETVVASYEKLNGNNDLKYQYGISFWVFINAFAPNNESFVSLLNYGNNPNILYNASTNTLMITMKTADVIAHHKLTDLDDDNNRILYKEKNVLLQKWNNITLNYTGGTLDVFINGKLVKSNIEVIPYVTLDNLTVGTNHGIEGGICNLVYFSNPLTITNVYYLYETLKNTTPPFIETM